MNKEEDAFFVGVMVGAAFAVGIIAMVTSPPELLYDVEDSRVVVESGNVDVKAVNASRPGNDTIQYFNKSFDMSTGDVILTEDGMIVKNDCSRDNPALSCTTVDVLRHDTFQNLPEPLLQGVR